MIHRVLFRKVSGACAGYFGVLGGVEKISGQFWRADGRKKFPVRDAALIAFALPRGWLDKQCSLVRFGGLFLRPDLPI